MKTARHRNVLILSLAGALAAAGVGYAAIPSGDGSIKGCYATTNGILLGIPHSKGDTRIVDSGEACRGYEKTIAWSQKGPKGDACLASDPACVGPKGDTGDACLPTNPACVGPPGKDGEDGKDGTNADLAHEPRFANVAEDGTLEAHRFISSATHTGLGAYRVTVPGGADQCSAVVSPGALNGGIVARTAIGTVSINTGVGSSLPDVDVVFTLPNGTRVDTDFHLVVTC